MKATIEYTVENILCDAEELKRFGAETCAWLVRKVWSEGELISTEKIALFNLDSQALHFKRYLEDLKYAKRDME